MAGRPNPATACFCLASEVRMVFTVLNGWKKIKRLVTCDMWLQSLKYLLSGLLQKSVVTPSGIVLQDFHCLQIIMVFLGTYT